MIKTLDSLIYRFWFWIGSKTGYLVRYSIMRDKSIKNAKRALEEAFTPEIKKMLEDNIKDDK